MNKRQLVFYLKGLIIFVIGAYVFSALSFIRIDGLAGRVFIPLCLAFNSWTVLYFVFRYFRKRLSDLLQKRGAYLLVFYLVLFAGAMGGFLLGEIAAKNYFNLSIHLHLVIGAVYGLVGYYIIYDEIGGCWK